MPREFGPNHSNSEANSAKRSDLKRILDADPLLPNLDHIKRYPGTKGPYTGLQDVLETSLDRLITAPKPKAQIIAVLGHHASGKTSNIRLAFEYIERRSTILGEKIQPTLIAYDSAIDLARQEKLTNQNVIDFSNISALDPNLGSGERDENFYRDANRVFAKAIKTAIGQGGIIFVEAPATGVEKENGFLGKDRGTTALRNLATGDGYRGLEYDLIVAAVVAGPQLQQENYAKRLSESSSDAALRSGATAKGTQIATQEASLLIANWIIRKPPNQISDSDFSTALATKFFPWELYNYFLLPENQGVILKNSKANIPEVTKEDLAPYDIFKRASELTIWEWLQTSDDPTLGPGLRAQITGE